MKMKLEDFERTQKSNKWQITKCAENVKEAIHCRYCNVKSWLFEAYHKQITKIDYEVAQRRSHIHEDTIKPVTELLSNFSLSSSFIQKSTAVLGQIKLNPAAELTRNIPRYVAPEFKFMRFTEEFVTLAESLFGNCYFGESEETSARNEIDFELFAKKSVRSQSLIEIPTYTQKLSSELVSSKHESKTDMQAVSGKTLHPELLRQSAKSSGHGSQG